MSLLTDYDWPNWLRGLFAAVIGGGANAVVGGVSLNMMDPKHFNSQSPEFFKLVMTLFAINATVSFFMYLKQSPLPQLISKTVTTTIIEKVQTPAPPVVAEPKNPEPDQPKL